MTTFLDGLFGGRQAPSFTSNQWMEMFRPPTRGQQLSNMLSTIGAQMMAAGAPSYDPGQSGRIMAQTPMLLQQQQQTYQDRLRDMAMFGLQFQRLEEESKARKERMSMERKRLGLEESRFGLQREATEARRALAGMSPDDPRFPELARKAYPTEYGKSLFRDPKTPQFITVQQGENTGTQRTLRKNDPALPGLLAQGYTEVRTPAANVSVTNQPPLQKIEPGASYIDPITREVVTPEGATTPAEALARDLTPAELAVDKKYAEEYSELILGGGLADAEKNIGQLRVVQQQLESGQDITGGVGGYLPTMIRGVFDQESVQAQETVEEVVQRNLKLILGGQFSEREGDRLISRAYNPRLDEARNAERVGRLLDAMETAVQGKKALADYFEGHGTIKGFEGVKNFTIQDFDDAIDGKGPLANADSEARLREIQNLSSTEFESLVRRAATNPSQFPEEELDAIEAEWDRRNAR